MGGREEEGGRGKGGVGDTGFVLLVANLKNLFCCCLSVLMHFVTFTELERCFEFFPLYRH